jgi:3',5'-cyclic-AMP phosphodiesterase
MLIAHISDTHVAGWNKKAYKIAPTAENLAHCVAHINQLTSKPDLVIVTGDITYNGYLEEAERAASLLDKLQYPYYIVPGNHDDRSTLWSVFGKHACPAKSKDFINYVLEGYDVRLIGMDSTSLDGPGGKICKNRIAWLEKQLALEVEKPTIIFMHHPPAKFGVSETDDDGFIGANKLGNVIAQHNNIKAILCGHIHTAAHLVWSGSVISTAPSMGMHLVLDLTLTHSSVFTLEAPGYQLHYFTPEKNLVSHSIIVNDVDGPFLCL